jgi:SAM-dependent methyltransferase
MKGKNLLYTELAQYYDKLIEPHVNTRKEVEFLKRVFEMHGVNRVLDVGCGTGRHAIPLARAGYEVVGIDLHEEMLEVARRKVKGGMRVTFLQMDVRDLSFREEFDAAICMWSTFYYLPQPLAARKVQQALRPGGVFMIEGKDWERARKPPSEVNRIKLDSEEVIITINDTYLEDRRIRVVRYEFKDRVLVEEDVCRTLSLREVEDILKSGGFKQVRVCSDLSLKPYRGVGDYHVEIIALK